MTREECEKRILELVEEAWKIASEYEGHACTSLTTYAILSSEKEVEVSVNNHYWWDGVKGINASKEVKLT